ncbi:MAG: retroviral-like aspartic protease family protein [Magnetococcales bacterium]|nr:retroviral-like aspartic protease family protein [Magnetococcales bacterium]
MTLGMFWVLPVSSWGEGRLYHCVDARGRTILKDQPCAPGERDRHPPPPEEVVPLLAKGARGQYWIPVVLNDRVIVEFLIDTGANVVVLPGDIVDQMAGMGLIRASDWLGTVHSTLADGSTGQLAVARLESLRIGSRVVRGVPFTVTGARGIPLLGTPVLEQLGAWRIDHRERKLLLPPASKSGVDREHERIQALRQGQGGGAGRWLRQCWRADGSVYLAPPPCPGGGDQAPINDTSSR